jgi:hypothetical protein
MARQWMGSALPIGTLDEMEHSSRSRDTGLPSAFDGMMSRIDRHRRWQTPMAPTL